MIDSKPIVALSRTKAKTMQTELKQLIEELGLSGNAAEEILATITAPTIEKIDTQNWTSKGINDRLGMAIGALLLGSIESVGEQLKSAPVGSGEWGFGVQLRAAYVAINSGGVPIYPDETRLIIDQLSETCGWPPGVAAAIKAIGRWSVSPAAEKGIADPTIEQVQATIDEIEIERYIVSLVQRFEAGARLAAQQLGATMDSVKAAAIAEIQPITESEIGQ